MNSVTVSSKYQVVIPQAVRAKISLQPGQKMQVIVYDNKIVLIPVRPIREARGVLKGRNTDVHREEDDEDRA